MENQTKDVESIRLKTSGSETPIKNILVTGGAGFVGGCLVRHLVLSYPEYSTTCFDNMGYCSSYENIAELKGCSNFSFIKGDITNPQQLEKAFNDKKIDTVFHLAAESHVDHSFSDPYRFTYNNAVGTQVVLETCKNFKIGRIIHMSTDEVYGEVQKGSADLTEQSILMPTNPYAASKASSDMLVYAYHKSFGLPVILLRCNNIYGPCQFPEKIIPKFISLIQRDKKCVLHGNGLNTRRYLYVSDAVKALDTVLHKGKIGSTYNAGTNNEVANIDIAKALLREFGYRPEEANDHIEFVEDRPFNDARYAIDSYQISLLGWSPSMDFSDGIKETVEWYQKYGNTWWGDLEKVLVAFPTPPQTPFRPDERHQGHQ